MLKTSILGNTNPIGHFQLLNVVDAMEATMEELFSALKYPFVYLDCSYILRNNIVEAQSLTRRLLRQHPNKFNAVLESIRARAECESLYYQQIRALQQAGIISSLITFEVFHECVIPVCSKVIPLFGQYSAQSHDSSIILWGENVRCEKYIKASTTLLDANCIVADIAFFDLVVGKELQKYIINDGTLLLIGNSPEKQGGTHMAYEVSLKSPRRKAASKTVANHPVGEDVATLKRIEYPYLAQYDLPEAIERMLTLTPQGYRNKTLGFLIHFFRIHYKMGQAQIHETLKLWSTEACNPPYATEEFNSDFKRIYYRYKGLPYDAALAKQFGPVDFDMVRLRKKNLIYIPHSFFQDLGDLGGKEVRAYLGIKLLEHTNQATDLDSLADILSINRRSVQPVIQSLTKSGHCYCKKGIKRLKVPNTYHSSHIVTQQEGYMSFTYNDIWAYVRELCELGERNRAGGALKLYLFFRWKFYSGEIFMSQTKLGEHLGLAQNSISDIVYDLQDRHFIQIRKKVFSPFLSSCEYILLR